MLAMFLSQAVLAFAFICVIAFSFGNNPAIIWLHMAYVLEILVLQALAMGFLVRLIEPISVRLAQVAINVVAAVVTVFLILLYCANIGSNIAWGGHIDFELMKRAPAHIYGVALGFGFSQVYVYVAIAALSAIIYFIYSRNSRAAMRDLRRLFFGAASGGLFRGAGRTLVSTGAVALFALYLGGYSILIFGNDAPREWRGEPLSGLFVKNASVYRNGSHRLQESLDDVFERETYQASPSGDRPNIVIIIADSMRSAHSQVYGYPRPTTPFLTSLYDQGWLQRVDFATSTCPETICGVMSTLSSREFSGITFNLFKLNDLLRRIGYRVNFFLSGDFRWQAGALFGDNIDALLDGSSESSRYSINDDRNVLAAIEGLTPYSGVPNLFYLHLMSPHWLGVRLEHNEIFSDDLRTKEWSEIESTMAAYEPRVQVYDQKILQTDGLIERIFGVLGNKGYLERSLVVILGDHGDALGEHGIFGHTDHVYQEFIEIPLLFFDSERVDYNNRKFATQIDIAPTIIDRLGLPVPKTWDGQSLLNAPQARFTYHQTTLEPPIYAVLQYDEGSVYKLIRTRFTPSVPSTDDKEMFFNLSQDPDERVDLIDHAPAELVDKMRQNLAKYRSESGQP